MSLDKIIPPLFAACCLPEDWPCRYAIHAPFAFQGFVCATDGRICCRVKAELAPWAQAVPDIVRANVPPLDQLPWDAKNYGEPVPLWDLGEPITEPCPECEGYGFYPGRDRGYDGRRIPCESCGGKGKHERIRAVAIDEARGIRLSEGYCRTLMRHGVTAVALPKKSIDRGLHPVRWTAGDIEGLLMPLKAGPCDEANLLRRPA